MFLLHFLCTETGQVTAALRIPLLSRAAQDPPAMLGSMNCSSTENVCQHTFTPPKKPRSADSANGNHFKSTRAKKCLCTKSFCELLMAALQLIYVKES